MTFSAPIILKACMPLEDDQVVMDEGLQDVLRNWRSLSDGAGGLPVWSMDFAMQNASVVSRSIIYDLSGPDIFITLVGDQCRENFELEKSKGMLDELIPKANADDVRIRVRASIDQKAPNYAQKSMSWNHDRSHVKYEALYLPFVGAGSDDTFWCFAPMAFYFGDEDVDWGRGGVG